MLCISDDRFDKRTKGKLIAAAHHFAECERWSELDLQPDRQHSLAKRCDCHTGNGDVPRPECAACEGSGLIDIPDPRHTNPETLQWAEGLVEFLQWRNLTESMGGECAMRMLGIVEFDPVLIEAVQVFDSERARLRHEREIERAVERERQLKAMKRT